MPDKLLQAAILTFWLNLLMAISSPTAAPTIPVLKQPEILLSPAPHGDRVPQE